MSFHFPWDHVWISVISKWEEEIEVKITKWNHTIRQLDFRFHSKICSQHEGHVRVLHFSLYGLWTVTLKGRAQFALSAKSPSIQQIEPTQTNLGQFESIYSSFKSQPNCRFDYHIIVSKPNPTPALDILDNTINKILTFLCISTDSHDRNDKLIRPPSILKTEIFIVEKLITFSLHKKKEDTISRICRIFCYPYLNHDQNTFLQQRSICI